MPNRHQQAGRYGGLRSWANTPDRTARTAPARDAGPGSVDYWLARLDPERFADATGEQRLVAADARGLTRRKSAHVATVRAPVWRRERTTLFRGVIPDVG